MSMAEVCAAVRVSSALRSVATFLSGNLDANDVLETVVWSSRSVGGRTDDASRRAGVWRNEYRPVSAIDV